MTEAMWVFGYGSLIWNPDFPVAEARVARVDGWRRSFCMTSLHYRGTPEDPGLVLALDADPAATCQGVALRVQSGHEAATLAALRERELVSGAYLETTVPAQIEGGPVVTALVYVMDRAHCQYCGGMEREAQARIIARASGGRGPNRDYLWSTTAHLGELGISDPEMEWLSDRVRALVAKPEN